MPFIEIIKTDIKNFYHVLTKSIKHNELPTFSEEDESPAMTIISKNHDDGHFIHSLAISGELTPDDYKKVEGKFSKESFEIINILNSSDGIKTLLSSYYKLPVPMYRRAFGLKKIILIPEFGICFLLDKSKMYRVEGRHITKIARLTSAISLPKNKDIVNKIFPRNIIFDSSYKFVDELLKIIERNSQLSTSVL